ncbi:MAG: hypothetical protein GXO75_11860 [Calditrichaeota bacterium]|nr:hypothetical protein [Calditrichota bacterium]
MRSFLFKLAFLAFVIFAAMASLGNKLDPVFMRFGDAAQVRSALMGGTALVFIASLALIVVRTIIGIVAVLLIVVIFFVLWKIGLLSVFGL